MATAQRAHWGSGRLPAPGPSGAEGTSRTSSSAGSPAPPAGPGREQRPAPKPIRRGVGALICLLLAIFAALGYFQVKALFIDFFVGGVKGLIDGFAAAPHAAGGERDSLAFHRGRPVQLRVWCTLLLPVVFGALLHLFLGEGNYPWDLKLFQTLWTEGETLKSGGHKRVLALSFGAIFKKSGAGDRFPARPGRFSSWGGAGALADIVDYIRDRPAYEEEELPPRRVKERAPRARLPPVDVAARRSTFRGDEGPLVGKEPVSGPFFAKKGKPFLIKRPRCPRRMRSWRAGAGSQPPSQRCRTSKPEPTLVSCLSRGGRGAEPAAEVQVPVPERAEEPVVQTMPEPKPPLGLFRRESPPEPAPLPVEEPEPVRPPMTPPMPEIQRNPR